MEVGEISGRVVNPIRFGIYKNQICVGYCTRKKCGLANLLSKRTVGWDVGTRKTHDTVFVVFGYGTAKTPFLPLMHVSSTGCHQMDPRILQHGIVLISNLDKERILRDSCSLRLSRSAMVWSTSSSFIALWVPSTQLEVAPTKPPRSCFPLPLADVFVSSFLRNFSPRRKPERVAFLDCDEAKGDASASWVGSADGS